MSEADFLPSDMANEFAAQTRYVAVTMGVIPEQIEELTPEQMDALTTFAKLSQPSFARMILELEVCEELIAERGFPQTNLERFELEMEARQRVWERT